MHRFNKILSLLLVATLAASACKSAGETREENTETTSQTSTEAGGDGDGDITERMAREHEGDKPVASGAAEMTPARPVAGQEVVYGKVDGAEVKGYLSMPEGADPATLPALVVIHEWWGLNDNIRKMTDRLAGEGYVALAVDLYGGQSADTPDGAKKLMQGAMSAPEKANTNLNQAIAFLEGKKADKLGVIGWCFGGGWSLQTAIMAPGKIDAAVIYYGRVGVEKDQLAKIEAPILGVFGSEDQGIPVATVRTFEANLAELGKSADITIYEGADHAFANPSGTHYEPEAARSAWEKTRAFFAKNLKGE
jgi:carboxymethylenebutenolidase